jgi:hypothetical protein
MRHFSAAFVVLALAGSSAWAQEEMGPYRTAISAVGGLSVGSSPSFWGRGVPGHGSDTAFAVGGGIAHDLTPRLTLEANGYYLDRNASAWSADAGFRLNLTPSGKSMVPYFAATGGVYSDRSRNLDSVRALALPDLRDRFGFVTGRGFPGLTGRIPGGQTAVAGAAETLVSSSRQTDALVALGGGVLFSAGPHVFVRPDVRAQMVFASDTRILGLFTLNFGYRF